MTVLAVGDFVPDQPSYLNTATLVANGVYPRPDGADGPLRGPVSIGPALGQRVYGAIAVRDKNGNSYMIAGTASALYVLTSGGWTQRGSGYTVPQEGHWSFAQFGEMVVATNASDPPLKWVIGDGAGFTALTPDGPFAPRARYVAVVEPGFVMLGSMVDQTQFLETPSAAVWWSAQNNGTVWPTPGTLDAIKNQSDYNLLFSGGAVTAIVPAIGGAAAAVFTQRAIYRVEYVGPSAVFSFQEVDRSRGNVCPNGVAATGGVAYFVSEDGFGAFNGTSVAQIGLGKVDRFFWDRVDRTKLARVYATVDQTRRLIVWACPAAAGGWFWLVLNYATNRWRYADDASLAVDYLMPARTVSTTLEEADGFPDNLDAAGAPSLDDAAYQGGERLFGGFRAGGQLASFTGATLSARVETGDADSQGRRMLITGMRMLTDADTATGAIGSRETLGSAITYTPPTGMVADGRCNQRHSGRYQRAVIQIPAAAQWTYLQGVDVTLRAEGRR